MDRSINTALSQSPARLVSPARVVFLLQDLKFGGTQRQALELARRLDPARFRPEIWLLAAGDDLVPLARDWGLPLTWLSRQEQVGPGALLNLWRRLRRGDVDLLLPFTVVPNIWGRILGRLARVPAHCGQLPGRRRPPAAARALAVAPGAAYRLQQRRLKAGAHPTLRRARVPAQRHPQRGGYGLFSAGPGGPGLTPRWCSRWPGWCRTRTIDTLIRAFAEVAPDFPQAQLWLVGEGPLLGNLQQLARGNPAAGRLPLHPAPGGPAAPVPAGRPAGLEFPHRGAAQRGPGGHGRGPAGGGHRGGGRAGAGDPGPDGLAGAAGGPAGPGRGLEAATWRTRSSAGISAGRAAGGSSGIFLWSAMVSRYEEVLRASLAGNSIESSVGAAREPPLQAASDSRFDQTERNRQDVRPAGGLHPALVPGALPDLCPGRGQHPGAAGPGGPGLYPLRAAAARPDRRDGARFWPRSAISVCRPPASYSKT